MTDRDRQDSELDDGHVPADADIQPVDADEATEAVDDDSSDLTEDERDRAQRHN
jgi:hypothetical protein